jgi:thioester reductase-like protein
MLATATHVLHLAARVSMTENYAQLRDINVLSTVSLEDECCRIDVVM